MLLTVAAWEFWRDRAPRFPPPLEGRAAITAVDAVHATIAPSQCHGGRPAAVGGRLLSPDRRRLYSPLRLVWPDPTDLDVLANTAAAMGLALVSRPDGDLARALNLDAAPASARCPGPTAAELVTALAGLHGLLTLAPTADSRRIAALVATAGNNDLLLPFDAEPAYLRTTARLAAMWAPTEGLAR